LKPFKEANALGRIFHQCGLESEKGMICKAYRVDNATQLIALFTISWIFLVKNPG